jgi:hypothetical protein
MWTYLLQEEEEEEVEEEAYIGSKARHPTFFTVVPRFDSARFLLHRSWTSRRLHSMRYNNPLHHQHVLYKLVLPSPYFRSHCELSNASNQSLSLSLSLSACAYLSKTRISAV